METRKLILCRGIQGSGKSFFARSWVLKDPEHRIRFNNDDIRNMMGKYWVPSRENIIKDLKIEFAKSCMKNGWDIVVDNMNLNPKEVKFWEDLVEDNNYAVRVSGENPSFCYRTNYLYEMEFKDFWTPVEECIRRDKERPNPIGEKVIKETWRKYRQFILEEQIKSLKNRKLVQDSYKPDALVIDMDATVCLNTTGRPFYGDNAASGMVNDEPINEICELVRTLQKSGNYAVIVVSGRENTTEIREATERWLHNNDIWPTEVFLRAAGDYSKGEVCKKNLIEHVLRTYNVQFIIEDNTRCVKMYRDMGLTVLQPNEGSL